MWSICHLCGAVVADDTLHATWHAGVEPTVDDTDPMED